MWPLIAAIAGQFIQSQGQQATNAEEYAHFIENREYNKPINQVQRLKEAGLNPVLAAGGFGAQQSPSPPSMVNPVDGTASTLASAAAGVENRKLKKMQVDLAQEEYQQRKALNQLKSIIYQQKIMQGDYEGAMKALMYERAVVTNPAVTQQILDNAEITGQKKEKGAIDLENYPAYSQAIIDNANARTNLANSQADYYVNKVTVDNRHATAYENQVQEQKRHNLIQESISESLKDSTVEARRALADIARKNYNLAVKKQQWDEAHYWYDLAAGAAGSLIKAGSKLAGWHFGLPLDKLW